MAKTKTGSVAPKSGQYKPLGYRNEITLSKGDRVPPYKKHATIFVLVDKTRHSRK